MKRILFLGDAGSSHLTKWVLALHGKHFQVAVFSLTEPAPEIANIEGLRIHVYTLDRKKFSASLLSKFVYLFALPELRRFAADFKPDIVHAHYASSYGLMGARLGKHPYIISAWGSDVFSFGDNFLGEKILHYNFKKADKILSTSYMMKERVLQFTRKDVVITPFGIDTTIFHSGKKDAPFFSENSFVFGMVKSMEHIYGVDVLLYAFASLVHEKKHNHIRLLLVGSGTKTENYQLLCKELQITEHVHFAGRINHTKIPHYHQIMDVFVNPSRMESFGVSVLEAMSCAKPVIVTAVGGLKEIVQNNESGLYVNVDDKNDLAEKMEMLLVNELLRTRLSNNARKTVLEHYNWDKSVQIMLDDVYKKTDI